MAAGAVGPAFAVAEGAVAAPAFAQVGVGAVVQFSVRAVAYADPAAVAGSWFRAVVHPDCSLAQQRLYCQHPWSASRA